MYDHWNNVYNFNIFLMALKRDLSVKYEMKQGRVITIINQ